MKLKLRRTILFTPNMEAMSAFYGEKLGLKRVAEEKGWREFAAGAACVALHSGPASPGRKGPKLSFLVEDVAAARAELAARGVKLGPVRNFGALDLCDFKDPDGNPVQLSNRP